MFISINTSIDNSTKQLIHYISQALCNDRVTKIFTIKWFFPKIQNSGMLIKMSFLQWEKKIIVKSHFFYISDGSSACDKMECL